MNTCKSISLILFLLVGYSESYCQDTITYIFAGEGAKNESFVMICNGKDIIEVSNRRPFIEEGIIRFNFKLSQEMVIGFYFRRTFLIGLLKKVQEVPVVYIEGYKYLIFYRDFRRKGKYAIDYEWSNEKPFLYH